jgi:hypothetical protein
VDLTWISFPGELALPAELKIIFFIYFAREFTVLVLTTVLGGPKFRIWKTSFPYSLLVLVL